MKESWESAPVLCKLKRSDVPKVCKVPIDEGINLVKKCFDYEFTGESKVYPFVLPEKVLKTDANVILIVGPSGAGKSTLLKEFEKAGWHFPNKSYDNGKAIISNFPENPKEGKAKLTAVGLSSIPTWCRPRNTLSTGEGFRADLALNLESQVMIDEYTSVVNRECALSASHSVQKYIRRKGLKKVLFCGCHYDIIPLLKPDLVIDTSTRNVYDLRGYRLGKTSTSPSSKCMERGSERSGTYSLRITI